MHNIISFMKTIDKKNSQVDIKLRLWYIFTDIVTNMWPAQVRRVTKILFAIKQICFVKYDKNNFHARLNKRVFFNVLRWT